MEVRKLSEMPAGNHRGRPTSPQQLAMRALRTGEALFIPNGERSSSSIHSSAQHESNPMRVYHTRKASDGTWVWWTPREK